MTEPNAETVIARLVNGGVLVSFELALDRTWLCRLSVRGHDAWNSGSDMASALLFTMLDLLTALASPPKDTP